MTSHASLSPLPLRRALWVLVLVAAVLPTAAAAQPSRTFAASYDKVWSAILLELAEGKIPINSQDKDAGVIRGQAYFKTGDSNPWVSKYTTQKVRTLSGWTEVQIAYTFYLVRRGAKVTEVRLDFDFSVFNVWTEIWRNLEPNGTLEREWLDETQDRLNLESGGGAADSGEGGNLEISSKPDKADVEIDGRFVGQTPATLPLSEGEHEITVTKSGYKPWTRTLAVLPGSATSLEAALVKKN